MAISLANIDVGGLFGGLGDLAKELREAITGDIDPAKKAEIAQKTVEFQTQLALAQAKVNEVEAANTCSFVSGWRPFVGWVCGIALAYNYVFMPFFAYCWSLYMPSAPAMLTLETGELFTLLFGMLGLGAMRSYEKTQGVASK